jgi:RNA polymerase sigma-70 factor, ECF subfamily
LDSAFSPAGAAGVTVARVQVAEDSQLLAALRAGDEQAFARLVEMYHAQMLRLAQTFVRTRAVAEEVVQEAWLGVLRGLDRFEGRSSLRTWIFRIVANTAKTRGEREGRSLPFSALAAEEDDGPAVAPQRFQGPDGRFPGGWASFPEPWDDVPEQRLLSQETRGIVDRTIAGLPPGQRAVITLRDVVGCSSEEVCNVLELSETNQRVLLHRARSKVRGALETYLTET